MSNIPPADFSQILPQAPREGDEETSLDPSNAREPLPHQPLVTQLPQYDPSKDLADQIAQVLGEPPARRDEQVVTTGTEFPTQQPAPPNPDEPPPAAPQPQPQPSPQPSTTTQSPTTGEGEGGSDAVSGPSAAPPEPPSEPTISLDALGEQLYGRPVTRDEALAIMQLWRDASQLTPEQKHQVAVAMGYVEDTTPQHQAQTPPAPSSPQQHQATTHPPPSPSDAPDPYLDPHIAPLRDELGNLRNEVQTLVSQRQLTDQQRLEQEANQALDSFRETHPEFTEEEHMALRLRARERGVLAAEYQRSNNLSSAINSALEYEMWQDENLRAKALQVQNEQQRAQETQDAQRQHKAASLGPGGSQVPRTDSDATTPPRVLDRPEMRAAMTAELAQHFNQQP